MTNDIFRALNLLLFYKKKNLSSFPKSYIFAYLLARLFIYIDIKNRVNIKIVILICFDDLDDYSDAISLCAF